VIYATAAAAPPAVVVVVVAMSDFLTLMFSRVLKLFHIFYLSIFLHSNYFLMISL